MNVVLSFDQYPGFLDSIAEIQDQAQNLLDTTIVAAVANRNLLVSIFHSEIDNTYVSVAHEHGLTPEQLVLRGDHWTPDQVKRICEGLRGRYDWNGVCLVLANDQDIGTMAASEVLTLLQNALPRLSDEELAAVGLRRLPDFAAITRDVS